MLVVLIEALLHDRAEIVPEFNVLLGRFGHLLPDFCQNSLGQLLADTCYHRIRLQHLAADVEWQILTVYNTAQEPQIRRQEIGTLVGDEYPPYVEFDPALPLRVEQVEWFGRWNKKKASVFKDSFCSRMQSQPWIIEAVPNVMIKFFVLLFGDFRFRSGPQGRCGVDGLFFTTVLKHDGQSDMVGVGIDDLAQSRRFEIFVLTLAQMDDDRGPACRLRQRFDRELAFAVGNPTPSFGLSGLPTFDLDLFSHHECRVETDPELADQTHILARITRQLADERGGARAGDGAEIFNQFRSVHADAIVSHGQSSGRLVRGQRDTEAGIAFRKCRFGQGGVPQSVARIRGIRNKLANKDFLLAVERVRNNI